MLLGGHKGEKHRFFGPKATFGQQGVHAQKYSPVLLFWDRNFRFWNFPIGWWKMLFKLHFFLVGWTFVPLFLAIFWPCDASSALPASSHENPWTVLRFWIYVFWFLFLVHLWTFPLLSCAPSPLPFPPPLPPPLLLTARAMARAIGRASGIAIEWTG